MWSLHASPLGVAKSRYVESGVIPIVNLSRTLPPVIPPNFISRKSILADIDIDQTGLTLVVAPGGYGKTSLVAEFVTSLENPIIWLSINDTDDTKSFNSHLMQSIRNIIPGFGKWFSLSADINVQNFLDDTLSELGEIEKHFILVLDDNRLSTGNSAPLAKHLLDNLPSNVHTIIIRKIIPSDSFFRIAEISNLHVIDQRELEFTDEEIKIAAKIVGVDLKIPENQKTINNLNRWPSGIQLTLNSILRGSSASSNPSLATGSAEQINQLVLDLLSTLKPGERKILESLAVLEEFSIEEAEIILDKDFSLNKLNRFAVDSLFLKYSSEPINKYSFPSVVRAGLIVNPTIDEKNLREIHRRLSEHFTGRGMYLKALGHAKFSGDQANYRTLFRQGMRQLIATGRGKDLLSMAELVGDATPIGKLKRQTVELMGLTADFQYLNAQSLMTEMLFASRGTELENFIKKFTAGVSVYIDFATGLTENLDENVKTVLSATSQELDLGPIDKLSILRASAAKEIIYDSSERLVEIQKLAHELAKDDPSVMALYFTSAIDACTLLNIGEYKEAYLVANNVISLADREGFTGVFGPLDMLYVKARCLLEFSQIEESQKTFAQIKNLAESWSQYTWAYVAESFLARDLALAGNSTAALDIVRSERERASALSFKNGLDTYCDLTELFIRYTMKDWDRVRTLLDRSPDFLLVQRIRAIYEFETGKKSATFVAEDLPEQTPTQQIYKLMAQTDQNIDREKVALQLMSKALEIGARVGAKETFLRQDASILNLVIRIAGEKPTVYLEDLASRITTRLKSRSENILGLSAALTKRELEILRHLATGKPISAIGVTLHISQNTMKTHLKNIYRKIGAGGRDEAVAKAKSLYIL
jgi:ATP/maltotriose-dependent transcriptional regulator MalT